MTRCAFNKSLYAVLSLLLVGKTDVAEGFEPITTTAIVVGAAGLIGTGVYNVMCSFKECCTDRWIHLNSTGIFYAFVICRFRLNIVGISCDNLSFSEIYIAPVELIVIRRLHFFLYGNALSSKHLALHVGQLWI